MNIKGRVIDVVSGAPLPGASITIVDERGKNLGVGVMAGNDGTFGLKSALIDVNYILVSEVEHESIVLEPDAFLSGEIDIQLTPDPMTLDEAVVTGKRRNYWLTFVLFLATVGTGVAVVSNQDKRTKKKRRVRYAR